MKFTKQQGSYLFLSPDVLMTHPRNLRRFYPEDQVQEMASSIRQANGVYQAMLVVPNGKAGKYFVVDGNVRLAGGRLLGRECPLLKCEIIDADKAEQLFAMAVTAQFRYDPDPISEALHYQRLIDEEGYTVRKVAHATGIYEARIHNRLNLLSLDPRIQELIGQDKLPTDQRVIKAFLSIEDTKIRVKLAERLARDEANVKTVLVSCERLAARLRLQKNDFKNSSAIDIASERSGKTIHPGIKTKWSGIREAAKGMCNACDLKEGGLKSIPEPAWSLISHAAEETCRYCGLKEIQSSCGDCPGVDMLRRIIMMSGKE